MIETYEEPRILTLGAVVTQTLSSPAQCKISGSGDTSFAEQETQKVTSTQTGTTVCDS